MRVVAIVGHSGSGKTTLIEKLIPALRRRGLSVSTIKHTHHHHIELDTPGKDSHRHRTAGASEVIIASDSGWARIASSATPASLAELLAELRPVDLVIIEGFKQLGSLRRVEVFRGAGEPLVLTDPGIAAVAAPVAVEIQGFHGTRLPLDDIEAVLEFILSG
ncbi:MAG TPA: molybdopterin-guanine dinucleotide biosynthesis protein B [Steroidobacteraceae bacterium]|jgi:molybdopterin-guanine dinucleotide biosynthesis protein B|nr:molybdopterin-guanine dinucleotide biosynthesis protein B [Steroidobacteraceae bacterium]